jgi:hypothetical protein
MEQWCIRHAWQEMNQLYTQEQIRWLLHELTKLRPEEVKVDELDDVFRAAIWKEGYNMARKIWEEFKDETQWYPFAPSKGSTGWTTQPT